MKYQQRKQDFYILLGILIMSIGFLMFIMYTALSMLLS